MFFYNFVWLTIVTASGPTVWTSTYAMESTHCNRLLIEPSCWAQTVHIFTLRLYVSRDLAVTPCAGCIFMLAFLRVYLRPREGLRGPFFRVVTRASCCLTDRSTVFCDMFVSSSQSWSQHHLCWRVSLCKHVSSIGESDSLCPMQWRRRYSGSRLLETRSRQGI